MLSSELYDGKPLQLTYKSIMGPLVIFEELAFEIVNRAKDFLKMVACRIKLDLGY